MPLAGLPCRARSIAMAFQPGQLCYLNYGEAPPVYHTRLVLGHVQNHEYFIRTPDGDEYIEHLDGSNTDLTQFFVGPDDGSLPVGVPAAQVYAFQPMTVAELNRILASGRQLVAAELRARGLADPHAPQAVGQMVWVMAEAIPGKKIGEVVNPPANHPRLGQYGLMEVADDNGSTRPVLIHQLCVDEVGKFCEDRIGLARASEAVEGEDRSAGEDVRTMEVKYAFNGERHRSFRDSVAEMQQVEFDDFPLAPRTSLAYLKAVSMVAESAFGQHLSWVAQSRIPEGDRAVHENEILSRALDLAISYDALNISNLASFELIIRRKQLLAEAHAYNPGAPSYEGADHYLGTTYRPGGGIIVPELQKHVSEKMHQESQILKEKRKQAELKGNGKGKNKNQPPPPKPEPKGAGAPSK